MNLAENQGQSSYGISARQKKILNCLIKEYIDSAEPISSDFLKKKYCLDVSPATIRNEFQELTERGYLAQPHTSAGRVPTEKGYRYFISITFVGKISELPDFIAQEMKEVKEKVDSELQLARELAKTLEEISLSLEFPKSMEEDIIFDMLKMMDVSRATHKKTMKSIKELLEEFEKL